MGCRVAFARRHPHSTKAVASLKRTALLEAKMETLPFNRRATLVEYVLVACTVALLVSVFFLGDFGANSQLAAPKDIGTLSSSRPPSD